MTEPWTRDEMEWRRITGARLKQARNAKGMYLRDLAKRVGDDWSVSRIAGYEQGVRSMSVVVGMTLAHALGVSPIWLLGLDGAMGFSAVELDLLARYRGCSEQVRGVIDQLLAISAT